MTVPHIYVFTFTYIYIYLCVCVCTQLCTHAINDNVLLPQSRLAVLGMESFQRTVLALSLASLRWLEVRHIWDEKEFRSGVLVDLVCR